MSRQRTRLRVRRVYKIISGSPSVSSIPADWPDGGNLRVENVADFDPEGGEAIIAPNEEGVGEPILYTSINEQTDELTGVTRSNPQVYPGGTFIQEGSQPDVEKWAEGFIDDEDAIHSVPVPASLYPLLHLGTYDDDTAPTIPVEYEEDEDALFVAGGPVGAVPEWDADLEVLPAAGGGDASQGQLQPSGKVTLPKGMGFEDGEPPDFALFPEVIGGIGNTIFVTYETGANSSIVKYKLHGLDEDTRTARGGETWEPDEDTLIETQDFAGTPDFFASFTVKDFPEGHVLDATASDPPQPDINYFFKIVPADGSGDAEGPYPEAGPVSPIKIETIHIDDGAVTEALLAANAVTETKIADDSISTPKLVAGAVQTANIAAGAIIVDKLAANAVTADKIAANSVTSDKIAANSVIADKLAANSVVAGKIAANAVTAGNINVENLAAIKADLGSITAGSITGVDVTGNAFFFKHNGSSVGQVFTISGGYALRGTGVLDNIQILSDRTAFHFRPDFQLTTQTGKTGQDEYIPILVNGVSRFLRVFN